MNTGMLWFDNRKNCTLEEKIIEAALYFRRKFGNAPTFCEMNPKDLSDSKLETVICPEHIVVKVRMAREILPSHILIGIDEPEKIE